MQDNNTNSTHTHPDGSITTTGIPLGTAAPAVCPTCGTCPTCGRATPTAQWPFWYVNPYHPNINPWQYPVIY